MANVFLSYDHEDLVLAKPIAAALEKAGHTVWYDRHIHGGAQYSRKIEQALDAADAVIVLWSPRSLESAWVRDEAAEGRDRGKLVPLSVEAATPPMGFRQFQTIDLGKWRGRGKLPKLEQLLEAVESQTASSVQPSQAPAQQSPMPNKPRSPGRKRWLYIGGAVAVLLALWSAGWAYFGRSSLPVVEVASADASPRSQAAASDLYVKLGSLAQIGQGKWQLVDAGSAPAKPDLLFRAADVGSAGSPAANLVLVDGRKGRLLWSREFEADGGSEADLRQRLSLTAGRVLDCALEMREAGGLRRETEKLFLTTCERIAEASSDSFALAISGVHAVLKENPKFIPAWSRLISADLLALTYAEFGDGDPQEARARLRQDMATARKLAPDLPVLTLADVALLPKTDFAGAIDRLTKAVARHPDDPDLISEQGGAVARVGQMMRGAQLAKRAAELDPLSPTATGAYILALAYSGEIDAARRELAKAERIWAGTGALRDTEWAFHLRFGDAEMARKNATQIGDWYEVYLKARANDPAATAKWLSMLRAYTARGIDEQWGLTLQGFGGFGTVDDMLQLLAKVPASELAENSYLMFRPALADLRRDPRFMGVAARAGLVDYWTKSGQWPDFCSRTDLPYNCKAEAAKYAT